MSILAVIRGLKMADFKLVSFRDNYYTKLSHHKRDIRDIIGLLPYFWNNEIRLDLRLWLKKGKLEKEEIIPYEWELIDIEDKVVKSGNSEINVNKKEYKKHKDIRKDTALPLGYLIPNKHYRIFIKLGDSEKLPYGSLTVKDKDEYQMQTLILLIGIIFAFIIVMFEKGCG